MISACFMVRIRLSVFLYCRIQLPQQSYFPCFLLYKTSVEYTRFYFSIAEVLIYTVEPRISCNSVFSKCWIVESNLVGAWVLLKPHISFNPILTIYYSLWTNHSLSPHKTCIYHLHPCSTQQLFYEVEIICFFVSFMTQQTVMMLVSLAGQIVYSTAVSDVNDKLMDFCYFHLFFAISS